VNSLELLLNLFIGSVLEVMLQKLVEAEKSFGKSNYAVTPKICSMNFNRSLTAPFSGFQFVLFSKCA